MFGIFRKKDVPSIETWLDSPSPEKAFLTLLFAAAYCDHDAANEELVEISAISSRTRLHRWLMEQPTQLQQSFERDCQSAARRGCSSEEDLQDLVEACALHLDPGLQEPLFAHCCDIIFADRVVRKEELDFLERLAISLQIKPKLRDQIVAVLQVKNRH